MKSAILILLRGYKRWISPMLPHSCRFVPTCSEYAMEAVERHGVLNGLWLAAGRLLRCQPFARSGFDPVPERVKGTQRPSASGSAAAFGGISEPMTRHY